MQNEYSSKVALLVSSLQIRSRPVFAHSIFESEHAESSLR